MKAILLTISLLLILMQSFGQAVNLQVHDTRSQQDGPTLYKREARLDFKLRSVIGVPGLNDYSTNLTIAPWVNDGTGNKHHQLNFNDGGIFYRTGMNNSATWESWRKLVLERADGTVEAPALSLTAKNAVTSVNGFYNVIEFTGLPHAALVYNSGKSNELMFGLHSNGYFYWGTGASAATPNYYSMELNGSTGDLKIGGKLRATAVQLSGNLGIGTATPVSKLDLGTDHADPSSYPNKITLWQGGANNYFGFGISTGDLDYFSQANHRFHTEYNGTPGSEKMVITAKGNVGIGTTNPGSKLTVKGKIHAEEIKVDLSIPAPDYVFEEDYKLRTLAETEAYIKANKHLPDIPSAKVMEKEGVDLGIMNMKLLQKIEEMTLYQIELLKRIEALEQKVAGK